MSQHFDPTPAEGTSLADTPLDSSLGAAPQYSSTRFSSYGGATQHRMLSPTGSRGAAGRGDADGYGGDDAYSNDGEEGMDGGQREDSSVLFLGAAEAATAAARSQGQPSAGEDAASRRVLTFSNGIQITFSDRRGWGNANVNANNSNANASANATGRLTGRRVRPYSTLVVDYTLLKALDVRSAAYRSFVEGGGAGSAANGTGVGAAAEYTPYIYASDRPLATRMAPGGAYEAQKDFSFQFVPSYSLVSAPIIYGLNIALPHLREGDEATVFVPAYLGPSTADPSLGADFRPCETQQLFKKKGEGGKSRQKRRQRGKPSSSPDGEGDENEDEIVDVDDDDAIDFGDGSEGSSDTSSSTDVFVPNPTHPAANVDRILEHSFVRLKLRRVMHEEPLTNDRYITKTTFTEGPTNSSAAQRALDFTDEAATLQQQQLSAARRRRRFVAVGSVVAFDIGEVNEYLDRAPHYRHVSGCAVAGACAGGAGPSAVTFGGGATCDELDIALLSMHEGEFAQIKIGSTRYNIKLLEIAAGTAFGEVTGDAATELARRVKDAGNAVLAAADATIAKYHSTTPTASSTLAGNAAGVHQTASAPFSSPIRPSENIVTIGSPTAAVGPFAETPRDDGLSALTAEILAARRYFAPPSDLTPNPILDALSTAVVRPPRRSYLLCAKPSSSSAASGGGVGSSSSLLRNAISKDSEPFFGRVRDEATYRALQLYKYSERLLIDRDGIYYDDPPTSSSSDTDEAAAAEGGTSSPGGGSKRGGRGPTSASGSPQQQAAKKDGSNKKATSSYEDYCLNSRIELLGTIYGNTAQVFLNLKLFDDAIDYATDALDRCAAKDRPKNLYRRAKALGERFAAGAGDAYRDHAIADLRSAAAILSTQKGGPSSAQLQDVQRELMKYGSSV